FLWRGSNVVFGAAAFERRLNARFSDVPEAVRRTGDVTERWGILTDLSPLQGPPGSVPAVDFRGENYTRAGLIRYRFAVASSDRMPADMDVPFTIYVGAAELPQRRLLWIASVEGETGDRESAPGPPVETYAPGPAVSGIVLVGPGPALVRIESPRPWESYGSISELDVAATPPELLIRRAESSNRLAPPSMLWDPPQGLAGDPKEASDTAAATRAIAEAPDTAARAVALEARARLMFRLGRSQCVPDLQQAELLFPEGSLDRDRVSITLAVVAFRSGDDLELRARVESIIRAGSRSRELFLLAAAAALGTDDLASARVWLHQARLETEDASGDLERFVAVALNETAPPGEPVDPLMGILTDLLRLRRLDPVTEVAPALEKIAARCEGEALLAAGRDLFGRGARFADWAREARMLLPYAGKSDWPPPRGMLAPLERARDLRSEEVLATPPLVRLAGRFGAWESVWMTEGAELSLSLPGPEVYEFQWRSAHAVDHGVVQRTAAPARIVVDGLPGIGTHDVLGSEPAESVFCERLPWAAPGIVDSWRAVAPAGISFVRVRVEEGAGFLSVRRVAGPVWMAWDARAGTAAADQPFPPPLLYPSFAPDPKAEFIADVRRRLDASRKAGPASRLGRNEDTEALTSLADDLLYAVFARRPGAQPEWVVRALDLYMKAHADGLGNAHWKANYGLARGLTRWTTVDLSADLPEFRRVRISQDLPDDPSVAVANALFFPFADEDATVLFNDEDSVEWHHRAAAELPLSLEIVASADPPSDAPIFFELQRDGVVVSSGPLEAGKRQMLAAGGAKEALVGVRVFSTRPLVRVKARARLLVETPEGLKPVNPERTGILYRAAAGKKAFEVRGPTLARLEKWDPTDLKATDDPAQWIADPAPIARTLVQGVPRAGAATAEFDIPHESFLRLSVRTVDGAALAALVPPDRPRGELAGEALAPPAPDLIPEPAPGRRDQWRLVEYPGMVETYALAAWRDRGSQEFRESPDRSDVEAGARLHWKPFETSMYLRLDAFLTKESGVSPVHGGRIRFHHYFLDVPDLDYLISVDYAGQALGSGYYGYSWEEDVRLRWRLRLDEQWVFFAAVHFNYWRSSLGDESFVSRAIHPLIHTDYRDAHYRWFQFEARLRAIPWQNVNVDMFATSRTEPTMIPWDTDRYHYGVIASAHYENCFVELEADRVLRLDDAHRSRQISERSVAIRTAYERWLSPGVWMSAQAGFRWSPDTHEKEATFALTFRFGGHSGDGLNHVDPENIRFLNYQQSRAPWRP
ncbi:MAG: hypothetical protein K8T20_18615, partial [Planctomycetes bacterium]|nr:hypothetical protein [Planctomycetota bacterium]